MNISILNIYSQLSIHEKRELYFMLKHELYEQKAANDRRRQIHLLNGITVKHWLKKQETASPRLKNALKYLEEEFVADLEISYLRRVRGFGKQTLNEFMILRGY